MLRFAFGLFWWVGVDFVGLVVGLVMWVLFFGLAWLI